MFLLLTNEWTSEFLTGGVQHWLHHEKKAMIHLQHINSLLKPMEFLHILRLLLLDILCLYE